MEIQNKNTEEGNADKTKDLKAEEIHRIVVSRAAEEALIGVVERVNDGFDGGRVNRSQVASWVIIRSCENLEEDEIKEIRSEHFDEVSVLESILRRAKKTGQVPSDMRALLQKQMGLEETPKRKSKKGLQGNVVNDYIQK